MKKTSILFGSLALATLLCTADLSAQQNPATPNATTTVAVTTLPVSTAGSTMTWNAKKFGGEHTGTIKLADGTLEVNSGKLVGGSFVIDMTSITVTDITEAGPNQKLTGHLKSDDFFSVEKHPTSTFRISKVTPVAKPKAGEANYTITGDLTIKGITNSISFPATVKVAENAAEAEAKIEVDRTKFDIKYRSGMLGTAADKVIYDTFTIDLKLKAGAESETLGSK